MTLAQRLKSVTHVSLRYDLQSGRYTVRVYSPQEAQEKAEQRDVAKRQLQAKDERIEALQNRLQELRTSKADEAQIDAVAKELREASDSRGGPILRDAIYRVIFVGENFMEVEKLGESVDVEIIPFHSIPRILISKSSNPQIDAAKRD